MTEEDDQRDDARGVQRGQLRPLATGVYTADLTSTPEAIVAQDRHIIVPATTFGQWLRSDDGDPIAALRF